MRLARSQACSRSSSARVLGSPKVFFSAARPASSTMSWLMSSRRVMTSLSSLADQFDRPRPPILPMIDTRATGLMPRRSRDRMAWPASW